MFRPLFKFQQSGLLLKRFGQRQICVTSRLPLELQKAFNKQVNVEFFASFTYLSMAVHFGRQDVSLPGCQKYFRDQVEEEREHAQKFIDYILRRGNAVILQTIEPPVNQFWNTPLEAFKDALELEKSVSQKLLDLRKISEEMDDLCSCLLIENEYLDEQMEEADKLSRHVAELEKIGSDGTGIFLFDKYLLKKTDK